MLRCRRAGFLETRFAWWLVSIQCQMNESKDLMAARYIFWLVGDSAVASSKMSLRKTTMTISQDNDGGFLGVEEVVLELWVEWLQYPPQTLTTKWPTANHWMCLNSLTFSQAALPKLWWCPNFHPPNYDDDVLPSSHGKRSFFSASVWIRAMPNIVSMGTVFCCHSRRG